MAAAIIKMTMTADQIAGSLRDSNAATIDPRMLAAMATGTVNGRALMLHP
jgi:hypothetical protein